MHAVFAAVCEDAGVLRGAVQQAVVVLYGTEPQPVLTQNPVRLLDLVDVVIRYADHGRIFLILEENRKIADPARRVDRVVYPVDVHMVDTEQAALLLPHVPHGRI